MLDTINAVENNRAEPAPNAAVSVWQRPSENDLYRTLVERAQVGLFVSQAGRLLFVNPQLAAMLGYTVHEMLTGLTGYDFVAPVSRDVVAEQIRQRETGVPGQAYDIVCLRNDGSTFDARVWGFRVECQGQPADVVSLHDISELKAATRSAERRAELLAQAEALAHIGSKEVDLVTGEVSLSVGMYQLLGEPGSDEPVHREWLQRRVPDSERQFVQSIEEGMQPGEPFEFEHRIVRGDGTLRTVLHRGLVEAAADGTPLRSRVILQDITSLRESERVVHDLANLDNTTLLPNRRALLELLETALQDAQRQDQKTALLVVAIDQFGLVNETLGYAGGDQLLKAVSQRLSDAGAFFDTLAHLGSGEFAGLIERLPEPAEASAQRRACQLIDALAEPFVVLGTEIFVTCSVGVSLAPADGHIAPMLLDRAQSAMRQACASGVNQVFFYTQQASDRATSRLAIESALRHALARKEMYLCYQPQVDLRSGRIVGVEALARWTEGVRGNVPPSEFIPVAEQTGLIISLGEWILRTACEDSVRWHAAGLPPVRVGVNLSMQQLQQPDIARRIQAILLETGMDPHRLGLEVTESMLLDNLAHVARTLTELRAIGIEISLDDFGTGYSNLGNLSKLPIDVLKIDRSFVHEVTAPTQDVCITRALIDMAHGLRMEVVAEGVETEGQLALLVASRCNIIQGYYFSRPVRFEAMTAMLQDDKRLPEHLLMRQARQRTLLLVDADDSVIASLRGLLQLEGYHIIEAHGGEQGLQRLAENEVGVILSGQGMPGMTGLEFLRRAKALYPDTVRMALAGSTELVSITDAINEGAIYKFISMPWDDERLRAHIREAFRHKEMADENRNLGAELRLANTELAQVNQRLQQLLATQGEQIDLGEARRLSVSEVLDSVPAPVIGFDVEGMVAFVNTQAQDLFTAADSPLGRFAEEALSPELLRLWRAGHGARCAVDLAGQSFDVVCRNIGGGSAARGKLMVFTVDPSVGQARPVRLPRPMH